VYVTNVGDVVEHEMDKAGAHKVKVKYLLHEGVGAERLQLRLFVVDVEGYTPFERHAHEHEVFMLRGKALVRGGGQEVKVESGVSYSFRPTSCTSSRMSVKSQSNSCARRKLLRHFSCGPCVFGFSEVVMKLSPKWLSSSAGI